MWGLFTDTRAIIGNEITNAILDYLNFRKMLKEVNDTILNMVTKVRCPSCLWSTYL